MGVLVGWKNVCRNRRRLSGDGFEVSRREVFVVVRLVLEEEVVELQRGLVEAMNAGLVEVECVKGVAML